MGRFIWHFFWLSVSSALFSGTTFIIISAVKTGSLFTLDLSLPWVRLLAVACSLFPSVILVLLLTFIQRGVSLPWLDVPSLSVTSIDSSSSIVGLAVTFGLLAPVITIASWILLSTYYELQIQFQSIWLTQFTSYISRVAAIGLMGYLGIYLFNENIFGTVGGIVSLILLLVSPIPYYLYKTPTSDGVHSILKFLGNLF
jgi:hypothetical protein